MPEQKLFVPRYFRDYGSPGERSGSTLVWQDFVGEHILVILGEPGAGKSTEFEQEAIRLGAPIFSVREFLRTPNPPSVTGPLFLDALDETRAAGMDQNEVLDQVIERLLRQGCPKVRLSCRAADWLGGLDRGELSGISPTKEVRVVELLPLTEEEAEQVAQDRLGDTSSEFMEMVRRHRLEGWLGNPQTLELMIEVARKGDLPATRTELFEKACAIMAQEENRTHRRSLQGSVRNPVGQKEILEAAGFLCALALIAGLEGFAADQDESDESCPPLDQIPGPQRDLRTAISSRLFRWQEGRAMPVHRTIAEFLAAKALCERIRGGLPLSRLLRLITGYDGGTLSDLRGLYAWIASLLTEHSSVLAARDPVALIFYGDPEPLPPSVKRTVLEVLESWALRDPWFFYEGGSVQAFGGLSDRDLIPNFRAVLAESNRPYYLRLSVLAILAYGQPLPEMAGDLQRIVYNRDDPEGIRQLALKGLIHVVSDRAEILSVLRDLNEGRLLDKRDELRGELLKELYPQTVGPKEVSRFLLHLSFRERWSSYQSFLSNDLAAQTPDECIADLMDSLVDARLEAEKESSSIWANLVGLLLVRAFELHGDLISPGRLWRWLQLGRDEGVESFLSSDHRKAMNDWFSAQPQRITNLYEWWLLEGAGVDSGYWHWDFWGALCFPAAPVGLWRWQLSVVEGWAEEERAEALFRSVVSSIWQEANGSSLEEIYAWVDHHPRFRPLLESMLKTDLGSRYLDPQRHARLLEQRNDEAEIRAKNLRTIEESLGSVRVGKDVGILEFLAKKFLGFRNSDSSPVTTLDRIRSIEEEFGSEISRASIEGFLAVLTLSDLPSPERIGNLAADNRYYAICYPLLVAVKIREERGGLPDLSMSPGLQAALAFEFAIDTHAGSRWFDTIIEGDPVTAASILKSAWGPSLLKSKEHIPHLYLIGQDPVLSLVAREIGLSLLESYPKTHPESLRQLMLTALIVTPREVLSSLVTRMNRLRGLSKEQYALWLAFSLLVAPEAGLRRTQFYLRKRDSTINADRLMAYLESLGKAGDYPIFTNPSLLARLIRFLGVACAPHSVPEGVWMGRHDAFESAQFIGNCIDALGSHMDNEAALLLAALRDDQMMIPWKEKLSHTAEQQRRKVREQRYQRPSLSEVVKVLDNREPTSIQDIFEVVRDQLRTLANEIENGPEDGYRRFWNITPQKRLDSPLPEDEARDHLRGLLNPRLMPLGMSAEIEGHYARDNRSDLKIVYRSMNLPIEIKRHYHREVWTAPEKQLKEKYSIDPGAGGFGIYLVLWFGEAKGRRLSRLPDNRARPTTAVEMEQVLRDIYSGPEWRDTEFICIDCSPRRSSIKKVR